MIARWTILLLSAWILFAAPVPSAPTPSLTIACTQAQTVEYAPAHPTAGAKRRPIPLVSPTPARPPYQPAPANRPPPHTL